MTPQQRNDIVALLNTGQHDSALAIVNAALEAAPDDVDALLHRGMALRAMQQLDAAIADFREVAQRAERCDDRALAVNARFQLGIALSERDDWASAYAAFETVAAVTTNADICAAMCQSLCRLDRLDEAVVWRHRTLRIRDREATCNESDIIPRMRPRAFDPDAGLKNIVSYSLFGPDPFYHQCAVTVARTTPIMFPEFTPRFYCAPDLPASLLRALRAAGAEVMLADRGELTPFAGLFWRFLAFDDPDVDVVLVRDVDSPILPRERAGIDLWLASDAPFYCLRDHPVHAEPLLAGMWGGFTGLLPKIAPLAIRHALADHSKFIDQIFLREVIWPRIRTATFSIDSYNSLGTSVDFPEGFPKHGRLHVGVSWTREQILGPPDV